MKVIIAEGTSKEIAALVVELQGRQKERFIPETSDGPCYGGANIKTASCP